MTMAPRIDADAVKARVSCVEVAHYFARTPAQRDVRAGHAMNCPLPGNHKHGDRNPSCVVHVDGWKCHGCGAGGGVFALWAAFAGLDVKRDFRRIVSDVASWARLDGGAPLPPRPVAPPPAPRPAYTPPEKRETDRAARIWEQAERMAPELDAWCERRGLDAELVALFNLARLARPADVAPGWCSEGRRVVAPVYDARGVLVSLKGRRIDGGGDDRKELPLYGHGLSARAFACPLARRMLAGDVEGLDAVATAGVLIVEGFPDYLTAATVWGDATDAPAVLGVWSGSLDTGDLLTRIPDGARVTVVPHNDAGTAYMRTAVQNLANRCDVWAAPYDTQRDLNDTLQHGGTALVLARLANAKRVKP